MGSSLVGLFFGLMFDVFGGVFKSKLYIHIAKKLRLVVLYTFAISKVRSELNTV